MNAPFNPGARLGAPPPLSGTHRRSLPSTISTSSAKKKYGTAWKNVATGSTPSSHEPRRHATTIPTTVPTTKLTTVETPTSTSVHGRAAPSTLVTDAGKKLND